MKPKFKIYGYVRVSTERQSLQRQINNITAAYPEAVFYTDKYTGSTLDRPNWNKLYNKLRSGDTVIFDSVSRMSRDAESGARLYEELYNKGITLVFLNEPHCNTETFRRATESSLHQIALTGNTVIDKCLDFAKDLIVTIAKEQIKIAFEQAEKERLDICKRVKQGMKAKKDKAAENGIEVVYGAKKGVKLTTKKSVIAKEVIKKHSKDFNGTLSDKDCMKLAGISRNSYYKYKAELKEEI